MFLRVRYIIRVYFNFSEMYIYYKDKLCKLYTDPAYLENVFDNAEEYNGSYKMGDPLPLHKFFSGTVVSIEDGCIIEPFADEPIAQYYKQVENTKGGKLGTKVTIEYEGYMVAGDILKIGSCKASYEYDPDFQYEKSMPLVLHELRCGAYESEMLRYNSLPELLDVDFGTQVYPQYIVRIDTYKQFKTYEQVYKGLFGQTNGKEFFKSNSLVFMYFQAGTGSNSYSYKDIYINDGTLYIELKNGNNTGSHDTGIGEYSFSVALPKSELQEVENIKYITK